MSVKIDLILLPVYNRVSQTFLSRAKLKKKSYFDIFWEEGCTVWPTLSFVCCFSTWQKGSKAAKISWRATLWPCLVYKQFLHVFFSTGPNTRISYYRGMRRFFRFWCQKEPEWDPSSLLFMDGTGKNWIILKINYFYHLHSLNMEEIPMFKL